MYQNMKWLHFSDLHFNIKGYDSEIVREKLIQKIESLHINVEFILISGDCFYQYSAGQKEQKSMAMFVRNLAKSCNCPQKNIYICKGNHDINRNDTKRNKLIAEIRKNTNKFADLYNELTELGDERFRSFFKSVTKKDYDDYKIIEPRDKMYRVISINTCLLSKDKYDYQKLRVCNEKLYKIGKKINNDNKLNILFMHHGLEWLALDDGRKFQHWIEDNNIDIVHCGHTHRAAVDSYNDIFRDIKQFTAGAIVIDKYAIPSFYLCENNLDNTSVSLKLFTYSKKTEDWIIDNQDLRKFKNGEYLYKLDRNCNNIDSIESKILGCQLLISEFNKKYEQKYNDSKIHSDKDEGDEDFNSWKIIHSLVDIGMEFDGAMALTNEVIKEITDESFKIANSILSLKELRDVIYNQILKYSSTNNSELDVSCWASRYARKYSRNIEIKVIKPYGKAEKLSFSYIKNELIKEVMDSITNNNMIYHKVIHNELSRMSEKIMAFLKNMGLFEINHNALIELTKEYITQKPHPWIINNNREELQEYNLSQAEFHIKNIKNGNATVMSQIECAYHLCSAFLAKYDDYIGCTETSPIIILSKSVGLFISGKYTSSLHPLPMLPYKVAQLKKDLQRIDCNFEDFEKCLNIIFLNIVNRRKIGLPETRDALFDLYIYYKKLTQSPKEKEHHNNFERIYDIFKEAEGMIAKSPLKELQNCFWVNPYWSDYEKKQQHLSNQFFVCVVYDDCTDVLTAKKYLSIVKEKRFVSEIIYVDANFRTFDKNRRNVIRDIFKGMQMRSVFIQKEDFKLYKKGEKWRDIIMEVIKKSRI